MKKKIFLDFEYIESKDRSTQNTICVTVSNGDRYKFYDLRDPAKVNEIKLFINTLPDNTAMISYNVVAEVVSLLRLGISIEKLRSFDWIDLWIEAKMFMLTHPKYHSKDTSLKYGALKVFKIDYPFDIAKDPISIILKGNYTDDEWQLIKDYNIADVQVLPILLDRLKDLWKEYKITYSELLFRGSFALENAINYERTNGFPMDTHIISQVFEKREDVKYAVAMECNEVTGFPIYQAKVKKRPKQVSFTVAAFEEFLKNNGLYQQWAKTDSHKVSTTEDEFEKWLIIDDYLSKNKDILQSIYYARSTIKQLNSVNLAELITKDGYIKTPPFPFHQKSGRSSPKPSLGFILNLAPWLRMCIKPKEGKAFISADWSQQEIALAGYFSQDKKLLESYEGDHYITNAIACGFVPENATKKSHPKERDMMKPTSLGIIYGMGEKSMAFRVESAMGWVHDTERTLVTLWTITDGQFIPTETTVSTRAYDTAVKFINGHKAYYTDYWKYVYAHAQDCKEKGYYKVPISGWRYFIEESHSPTQLQNIPNQAGGAAVMQLGYIIASKKYNLRVVCPLHDALYIECDEKDIEINKEKLLKAMAESVAILTNNTVKIRNEVKVYTNKDPYTDPRGVKTYELIKKLIGEGPNV